MAYLKLAQMTAINSIGREIRQRRIDMVVAENKDSAFIDLLINHELAGQAAAIISRHCRSANSDHRDNLIAAAALLIAEIERLDRLSKKD